MSADEYALAIPGVDARRARMREVQEFLSLPFPVYAKKYLKIRTKYDGIKPLELNAGQLRIWEHTQAQMETRGYVRTMMLKARQFGGCLDPATPVLTADLRWVPISQLREGDVLIACDESTGKGKGACRKMQTATVSKIWKTHKQAYRLRMSNGTSVVCSADHSWLAKPTNGGNDADWLSLNATHPDGVRGGLRVGYWIRSVTEPWGEPTLDDAWLGGMIDGEGCFGSRMVNGCRLSIAQLPGPVFQRVEDICNQRGYEHYIETNDPPRDSKFGTKPVYKATISAMRELFRIMGLSRPTRFIGLQWWIGRRLPNNGWHQIVSIELCEKMDLIDIETSTGTFIANGLVSHNSTVIQAMAYRDVTCGPRGTKAFIMTHRRDTTSALFAMTKRFNDLMDPKFRPQSTGGSATSLRFEKRDSMYSVGTAGAKSVGHGETTQFLHSSEFVLWPNASEHLNGIFQTVPPRGPGTKIFVESTAKGMGNEFHRMCVDARKGDSDYWFLFIPWQWFPEWYSAPVPDNMILTPQDELYQEVLGLTDEQMAFRAMKINEMGGGDRGEAIFCSQYPSIPEDAFRTATVDSYFNALYVVRARKTKISNPYGARIMGIDPSHVGGDRFSVCMRQGRKAWHVGEWRNERTNVSLGRCVKLIKEERPEFVFVDQGGPGAGICDLLMEQQHVLGCRVIPVDFGGSPDDEDRYGNKREEMYGRCKEWIEQDLPVQIDDRDDLQTDLTNPQYRYDNAGRVQPESKQTMCKPPRSLPSPDLLESLVLTFAHFVKSTDPQRQIVGSVPDPRRPINWRAM